MAGGLHLVNFWVGSNQFRVSCNGTRGANNASRVRVRPSSS